MEPEKDAVRGYWDSRPCGTTLSDAPIGSGTFFTEVEQRRYAAEPFIRQFADFGAWRGARILEIGVGVGSDFVNFVRRGADAVGIDLTPAAISLVRRRLAIESLSIAKRLLTRDMAAGVKSIPTASAPRRTKFTKSLPTPTPISKMRAPRHAPKSANWRINGSAAYRRCSTSVKNVPEPIGASESVVPQGRESQYPRTASFSGSINTG